MEGARATITSRPRKGYSHTQTKHHSTQFFSNFGAAFGCLVVPGVGTGEQEPWRGGREEDVETLDRGLFSAESVLKTIINRKTEFGQIVYKRCYSNDLKRR